MKCFSRAMLRKIHEDKKIEEGEENADCGASTALTVWRKSQIFSCDGFTVIDSRGDLVYRVDNYGGRRGDVMVLMNGLGKPILSVCHRFKNLGLVENWLIYEGDYEEPHCSTTSKRPLFWIKRKSRIINTSSRVLAQVYREATDKRRVYVIEGSYAHRSCRVLDESRKVVAEIKRKESTKKGFSFGVEVFVLIVQPGFDSGFAMALVLSLDQMF